jgi:hypothetical protein
MRTLFMPVAIICLLIALVSCNQSNAGAGSKSSAKAINAFSVSGASGTIDQMARTIKVAVPNTNFTGLKPTFTTTGQNVMVGGVTQVSGQSAVDFTSIVSYLVTAEDGSTATYLVTVRAATGVTCTANSECMNGGCSSGQCN